ncbi:MAG: ABC transporter substrate-binding protein [Candidatus Aenigmarchaeota archaeon]|nr:ABC transporter substrate-binding protein [Candidatus Aenigmarchaeota archaeon]
MQRKKLLGTAACLGIALLAAGLLQASPADRIADLPTTVRFGNLPVIHDLPVYMAIEKGYFREAGIDVQLVSFQSPNQIVDALLQHQVDIGGPSVALGIAGVANQKNPGKLKIYAIAGGNLEQPNDVLLVRTNSTITSIGDLRGKRLGILGGSIQWRTIARHILEQNGLRMEDVAIIELAPGIQVQALASGQIDALLALEPIATVAKEQGAATDLVREPAGTFISLPFYGGAGVVSTEFASKHPETTENIIRILERTVEEIEQDPEEAAAYLRGYTPLPDDVIANVPVIIFKVCEDITPEDVRSINAFYDLFLRYGVVEEPIRFGDLAYCTG